MWKRLSREKRLWHAHLIPSGLAALLTASLAYVMEATLSNVILFASLGASALILSNATKDHLMRLNTAIKAYIIAATVSSLVFFINNHISISLEINIFILVFLVSMLLYFFDAFHPPAVSASLSFILLDRSIVEFLYLLAAILFLFVILRLLVYVYSHSLQLREFLHDFRKE